jgi:hypothetical protein
LVKRFLKYLEVRYPRYHEWIETWRKKIRHLLKRD